MATAHGSNGALSSVLDASRWSEREEKACASPQTVDEVCALARHANARGLGIEIAGAGTKRGWGNKIDGTLLLDMTRLTGIREHVWQDLTATVAAGTPWGSLQQALAAQNQRIALDPLWPGAATVGGIVATNDSGALRSRYGSLRDLIIGMTLVLADGTLARTGGKVVKNVAGYDLHKLMTGAFGTLGIITEVTFRLHPMPKAEAHWTAVSPEIEVLEGLRHQLADSTIAFEALQLRTRTDGFAMDIALASLPECMESLSEKLHLLAAPVPLQRAEAGVWSARERSFVRGKATVKMTLSPDQLAGMLSRVRTAGGEGVAQQCGILTASLPADPALIASMRDQTVLLGGALTVLHWPALHASSTQASDPHASGPPPDPWGPTGNAFPIMQEIKAKFDPNRILNPGRFVGGL